MAKQPGSLLMSVSQLPTDHFGAFQEEVLKFSFKKEKKNGQRTLTGHQEKG